MRLARRSGMVEMDMGQQDRPNLGNRRPSKRQRRPKRLERGRRARIDDRDAVPAHEQAGGDDLRLTEETQIDVIQSGAKRHGVRVQF